MKKLISGVLMASAGLLLANMPAAAKSCCPHNKGAKAEKLCPSHLEGVETKKEKLPNGLEITITAGDKETIEKAQAAAAEHYSDGGKNCKCVPKGAEVKMENIENGVKVVITGKTRGLIKKIQAKADKDHDCKGHKNHAVQASAHKVTEDEVGKEAVCPVRGEKFEVTEETVSASYKGEVYYFCCPACEKPFMENPEKYLQKKQEPQAKTYACPMGCAESDKPGKCPKCGMNMVEKK